MQARLNTLMENLAKRGKARRLKLGMTQVEVATASGLKQADISKIEIGLIREMVKCFPIVAT